MDITEKLREKIKSLSESKETVIVAIDGRCAAGKTTLAEKLSEEFSCNVFHMDDFFLRPEQRTAQRYSEPGGNVDRERFLSEVLNKLKSGKPFSFRPFDCHTMSLGEAVEVKPKKINIIEGTYSCHPELWEFYDVRIFATLTKEKQADRLLEREGANFEMFQKKWIPLEESYFSKCIDKEKFDFLIES